MAVTVYTPSRPASMHRDVPRARQQGIQYEVLDVSADEAALEHVKSLGYMQPPSS